MLYKVNMFHIKYKNITTGIDHNLHVNNNLSQHINYQELFCTHSQCDLHIEMETKLIFFIVKNPPWIAKSVEKYKEL